MIHYSFVGYMLATAIVLIVCIIAYRILLEKQVRPSTNRLVLLSICALSFILPLVSVLIPESRIEAGIEIGRPEFAGVISTINGKPVSNTLELSVILLWISRIYYFGLFLTFFVSLLTILHLVFLLRKSRKMEIADIEVYVHDNKKLSSFSWCNKIFLFEDTLKSKFDDIKMLVSHEMAHLEKGHWMDLSFAQIVLIFQWFNPAAWFIKRELQRIHEYEADEVVLQTGVDEKDYQMLLIQNISGNRYSGLTDGLNNCSLKKRIIMMKKTKFKKDWVARGIAVCGFAILGGWIIHIPAVASLLETTGETQDNKQLTVLSTSSTPVDEMGNTVIVNEENIGDAIILIDGKESSYEELKKIHPEMIDNMTVFRNPSKIVINLKKEKEQTLKETTWNVNSIKVRGTGTIKKETDNSAKDNQSAFNSDIVEQPEVLAEYEGGQSQLLKDLIETMVYPEEAKEKKIEGKVVVRFQVNTNGTLSNCEVAYSQNPILDEAALKAIEDLPGKWQPAEVDGKPVASVFNIPVSFKLRQ